MCCCAERRYAMLYSVLRALSILYLGSASERAKGWGGSLGKIGSFSPGLLRHLIGQVRYGRGRKGKHKCWQQSLARLAVLMVRTALATLTIMAVTAMFTILTIDSPCLFYSVLCLYSLWSMPYTYHAPYSAIQTLCSRLYAYRALYHSPRGVVT